MPVYQVGCERAVHFYAMQYVEGQTLAQVTEELRRAASGRDIGRSDSSYGDAADCEGSVSRVVRDLTSGRLPPSPGETPGAPEPGLASSETERQPQAAVSTEGSASRPDFFRSIADLGIQAAEALDYAHQMGVVHRDVKPSNLMLDANGHLWIADFGLAMTQTDVNLTMSGDLLGTLRYMSPEQVQAERGVLDHRTDVYSLGLTLYELLTLRPGFPSSDRQKLMRLIIEEDPRAPRQLNAAIARDLETIILKAIAKEPRARYATAGELSEDLRRFLADKPIEARRPSPLERMAKWSRRHRSIVYSVAVILAMTTVALSVSTTLIARAYRAEMDERTRADANAQLACDAADGSLDRLELVIEQLAQRDAHTEVGDLVDHAIELHNELPVEGRSSPRRLSRLASMHYQHGWGSIRAGDYETADRALCKAIGIYEQLAVEGPGRHDLLLARCYYYLGNVRSEMQQTVAAKRAIDRMRVVSRLGQNGSVPLELTPQDMQLIRDKRDDPAIQPEEELQ